MRILNYFYIYCIAIIFHAHLIADDMLTIHTSSGITSGAVKKGVITWHDIPYAEAPIGELRWQAPRNFINKSLIIKNREDNFCVQKPSSLGGAWEIVSM